MTVSSRHRRRRGHALLRLTAASLCLLLVGGGLLAVMQARGLQSEALALEARLGAQLSAGATDLQSGKDLVAQASQASQPALLDQANTRFASARAHFQTADAEASDDPVVRRLLATPYLGKSYVAPRLAAVHSVAAMGVALSQAGLDVAAVDALLIAPGAGTGRAGGRVIQLLKAVAPGMAAVATDLQTAAHAAELVDASLLSTSQRRLLDSARASIVQASAGVEEFARLSPALLEILGANGPRTYLVEQVDPAELRAGGGYIGSFTTLTASGGDLSLGAGYDSIDTDGPPYPTQAASPAPGQIFQAFGHGLVLGDSNFSPDFAVSAQAGINQFKRELGKSADGVISIDPDAVAALLDVTGPIVIPEYGTTVQAATFPEEVFQRLETVAGNVAGKKDFFPVVASRVIDRVTSLDSSQWPKLLGNLNAAVTQRHMQFYFTNQQAEAEMARFGWAGALAPPPGYTDFMAEVESNYGASKANHFVTRSYDVSLSMQGENLVHRVAIQLVNRTPPGYEGGRGYNFYLRFYLPAGASQATISGLFADRFPPDENPGGMKLLDGWYLVDITDLRTASATHEVVVQYTTPVADLATGHSVYWRKQAGTGADAVKITFQSGANSHSASSDLSRDRVLIVSESGLQVKEGVSGAAQLPFLGA